MTGEELCYCPVCGRAHRNLGFGKPPDADSKQVVPVQPTPEMLDAAGIPRIAAIGVWTNMLKVAPK